MRLTETPVDGAFLVAPEPKQDDRGSFARLWCRETFAAHGLPADFVQCNQSISLRRGTLRGLHYQAPPFAEVKLVRCVRGAIFDVIVDVRPGSPTAGRWFGAELSDENGTMMYVPEGCAHGYLALRDRTEVEYPVTRPYHPESERGVRWNDPAFGIDWPTNGLPTLSEKDRRWPDYAA